MNKDTYADMIIDWYQYEDPVGFGSNTSLLAAGTDLNLAGH